MSSSSTPPPDQTSENPRIQGADAFDFLSKWRELLLLIPGVHLVACFSFMFFYNYAFGFGLSNFSSATDAFSVSLSEIVPTYVWFGIWVGAGAFTGLLLRQPNSLPRPDRSFSQADRMDKFVIYGMGIMSLLVGILFIAYKIAYEFYHWSLLYLSLMQLLFIAFWYFAFFKAATRSWVASYFPVVMLAMSVVFGGLSQGLTDRTSHYADIKDQHAWCSTFVILRPVSSNFLAVGPDESRVIIDPDCHVRNTLVPHDRYRPLPTHNGLKVISDALGLQ